MCSFRVHALANCSDYILGVTISTECPWIEMLIWNWCQAIEASMEWMAASDMAAVVAVKVRRRLGLGIWATFHVCKLRLDGKVVFNL